MELEKKHSAVTKQHNNLTSKELSTGSLETDFSRPRQENPRVKPCASCETAVPLIPYVPTQDPSR